MGKGVNPQLKPLSSNQRCGRCGCPLDHEGQPCGHVKKQRARHPEAKEIVEREIECDCISGVRADVLQCMQNAKLITQNEEIIEGLHNLGQILLVASNLEVTDKGEIVPRHGGIITPA
jgi:iron only hydrogenase large subunit-like protein